MEKQQSESPDSISNLNQGFQKSKIPLILRVANPSNTSTPQKQNSNMHLKQDDVINLRGQEYIKKESKDFLPRKPLDYIVLQNDLNYFEDEQEESKNSKKYLDKQQKLNSQNKTNDQELYYNPIILADNTKLRERKLQNHRNQYRNNSLESKFLDKPNIQLHQQKTDRYIKPSTNQNSSFNFIKVDSCQQLEMENINNSSNDSNSCEYQNNQQLLQRNINQQQDLKYKKDILQNQNAIPNTVQIDKSKLFTQNLSRSNQIKIKKQPSLLPPIHPQKIKPSHNQDVQEEEINHIQTDFIRKSRSNSFTEQNNIFKMNVERSSRVSSSEFKNLLSNQNFQQIQKNLSRNQKAQTQNNEQNYNVAESTRSQIIQKYSQNLLNNISHKQSYSIDKSQISQSCRKIQQGNHSIERQSIPLIIQQANLSIEKQQIPLIILQPDLEMTQERQETINIQQLPEQQKEQQMINIRNIQQNQEELRQSNQNQPYQNSVRQQSNYNNRVLNQQRNNQQAYNDIIQRRNQIDVQQENLNNQFQNRQNTINQNPPPRFMIDNMYNQFIEFQNQLRQHQGSKVDKFVSTTVYKSSQSQNLSQDAKQCSICLCEFEDDEKISFLACFHRFHNECIHKWLETKSTCPLCKNDQKTLLKDVNKLLDEF